MARCKDKWIWPVAKFWTFSPLGFVLAVLWNMFEYAGVKMPFAKFAFGVIIGRKGVKQ